MSLVLCPQVVSQAPQHFRSSDTQLGHIGGCFGHQCICSIISLQSSISRAVYPQGFSDADVSHADDDVGLNVLGFRADILHHADSLNEPLSGGFGREIRMNVSLP